MLFLPVSFVGRLRWLRPGCGFYGSLDSEISGTATNITVHGRFDFLIGWTGITFQQRSGIHNLPRLAVAALRHIVLQPRFLYGVIALIRESLNSGDLLVPNPGYREHTGPNGCSVKMDCTGTALCYTASVFGTHQI